MEISTSRLSIQRNLGYCKITNIWKIGYRRDGYLRISFSVEISENYYCRSVLFGIIESEDKDWRFANEEIENLP